MSTATDVSPPDRFEDLPPQRAVALLLDQAVRMRASDLFFASNEDHVAVLVRHLGMVRPLTRLSSELGATASPT